MFENLLEIKNWKLKIVVVALSFFLWSDYANAASLIKPANTVGMVGWWRFDEGGGSLATDFSGLGNNGTLVDMEEVDWVAGHVGTALDFDGGGPEYVSVGNSSSLNPTSVISMVAWVHPRTFGSGVATLIEREYLSSYLWYLNGASSDLIININGNDAESDLAVINTNVWQHVAVTYDGSSVRFYVNALPAGVSPMTGAIGTDATNVSIGNDKTLVSPFDGYIDDFRMYNRVLSQVEIRQIMEGDRIARYATTPDATGSFAQGLVGHWTLDGKDVNWGSGRVTDKSTQGNNGYVINMSTTSSPVDGKLGQALNFDGSNDYVRVGTGGPTSLAMNGTNAFSISLWIKPNTTDTTKGLFTRGFVNSSAANTTYYLGTGSTNGRLLRGRVSDGVNLISVDSSTNFLTVDVWAHAVLVFDGVSKNLYLYQNGTLNNTATNVSFTALWDGDASSDRDTAIGSSGSGAGNYEAGTIDDVRVYNRALSVSEINKLYNLGKVTHDVSMSGGGGLVSGLVGWWTMDGKDVNWGSGRVADKSTQGNNGYVINMSTTSSPVDGKFGQAFDFDGVNDRVTVLATSSINDLGPMTISVWINPKVTGSVCAGCGIVTKDNSLSNGRWILSYSTSNVISFAKANPGVVARSSNTNAVFKDKWQHVVATWDGLNNSTGIKLYVDGEEVASYTNPIEGSGSYSDAGLALNIGSRGAGSQPFTGLVDDVRVYNRVLSTSEIQQLYNGRR